MSVEDLSRSSQQVLRVKVLSRRAAEVAGFPHWRVDAEVLETLRGREPHGRQAQFILPGGLSANKQLNVQVSGVPDILPGHEYVLFLSEGERGQEKVITGWTAYVVSEDRQRGERYLRQVGDRSIRRSGYSGAALSTHGEFHRYEDFVGSVLRAP